MARRMHIKDGYAIQLAIKKGYKLIVVSGSQSDAVINRLNKLGVIDIRMNVSDKLEILQSIISEYKVKTEELLFMGDDMPDLPAIKIAGLSCCPADAATEIKEVAHYISPLNGGMGCVRDVIEKVLKLNSHWSENEGIASI
jgi:3-deoxy-D-manno-octulosonate 8-phosphate phosphatase (KDO 8-P phosphatase)